METIKRMLEAVSTGDIETMLVLQDRDWEGFVPDGLPLAGTWRGQDGMRAFAEEWLQAWDEFRVEAESFIVDGDTVLATVHYWGRGRASGVEVAERWHWAYRFRQDKVVSWRPYADHAEALADLRLKE